MNQSVLRLQGFVNFDTVRHWLQEAEQCLKSPVIPRSGPSANLVVDFSELKGFNSAVFAFMLAIKRLGFQQGVAIDWQAVPASLLQLAQVYNLLTILGLSGHE